MNLKRIIIFDDDDGPRRDWAKRLSATPGFPREFKIDVVDNQKFQLELEVLKKRRTAFRKGNLEMSTDRKTLFDETTILIVDYDLLALDETGEEVAYLARCFSDCGIIVAVNQFAREGFTFDLTLQGHPDSFADLNLLVEQVFEPGLWSSEWSEFRPWYWPVLPNVVNDFEQRTLELRENLDEKILDFINVPAQVREIFPVSALEFLSSEDVTFRRFVEVSGKALRGKDRVTSDHLITRIAAARISKWLERLVLPGQNILVDAAHLLERYPSLYRRGSAEQLIGWVQSSELLRPGQDLIDLDKIAPFRFTRDTWLSRTAWYWPLVSELEEIPEVANPWAPRPRLAFCEDTSRFASPEDVTDFVAKVDSPFTRRFVSVRNVAYGPRLQFAL